jgi:hypothetical protein
MNVADVVHATDDDVIENGAGKLPPLECAEHQASGGIGFHHQRNNNGFVRIQSSVAFEHLVEEIAERYTDRSALGIAVIPPSDQIETEDVFTCCQLDLINSFDSAKAILTAPGGIDTGARSRIGTIHRILGIRSDDVHTAANDAELCAFQDARGLGLDSHSALKVFVENNPRRQR